MSGNFHIEPVHNKRFENELAPESAQRPRPLSKPPHFAIAYWLTWRHVIQPDVRRVQLEVSKVKVYGDQGYFRNTVGRFVWYD